MKPDILITAFRAAADNCVAVSFIKAMMAGKGFYSIKVKTGKIYLFLRDGTIFTFTPQQIKLINSGNGIRYARPIKKGLRLQVEVLFALLVLQLQLHGYQDKELTRSDAKKLLIKGIETRFIYRWLGIKQKRNKYSRSGRKPAAILLSNDRHIAFAANGYFDKEGTALPLADADKNFLFGPPTYYYQLF